MPPRREYRWVRVKVLSSAEKAAVAATCERLITDVLKPRFLPEIRPTEFNYPVDICGRWRGNKYSFITRYRSGFADNAGEEFDSAHARIDHLEEVLSETLFDVMWHRHTGQWFRLRHRFSLDQALNEIATNGLLWPL
ncbi:MAG TPA: hypothetical protein VMF67_17165 [Rhizomicrobium sp.]|nr:hypothetical protein [Rhizomicrobium sp.]